LKDVLAVAGKWVLRHGRKEQAKIEKMLCLMLEILTCSKERRGPRDGLKKKRDDRVRLAFSRLLMGLSISQGRCVTRAVFVFIPQPRDAQVLLKYTA
jgi:hypothetical protein